MDIPFVDLKQQYEDIMPEITNAVINELHNCNYVYSSANELFENNLANYIGTDFALGCSSGTAALHTALAALNIKAGDEVIVPSNSFIATALAVTYTGATPIFADVDSNGLIDFNDVVGKITEHTKAVIPVHLFGNPVDIGILRLMLPPGIYIIEDAAQALGGTNKGKMCGAMGDIGCFSFYPAKNLGTCGQGGAVVCNNVAIRSKISSLLNVGRGNSHYDFNYKGFNYRLDAIKASFLNVCLPHIDSWNFKRNLAAKKYIKMLKDNSNIRVIQSNSKCLSTYHLFVIKLVNEEIRNALKEHLGVCGVSTGIHYPIPIHKTKAYKEFNDVQLPFTEHLADTILSLPMFPTITDEQIEYVCKCINNFIGD